jgi:2-aminoadipate transaminase
MDWEYQYSERALKMRSSVIRDMLALTEKPEIISFGGGLPGPQVFPIKRFKEACCRVLDECGELALQYGSTEGYRPLREWIAGQAQQYGVNIGIENVLITNGSQQVLDLIGRVFINPGDLIATESPTYISALQAWRVYGARFVSAPSDEHGLIVDQVEEVLKLRPKFLYVLPNFQNPSGTTLSLERRQKVIELADQYHIPVLEDDPYYPLRYEGEPLPRIISLEAASRNSPIYDGNVIYTSTFSKLLAPGIRLGWVIGPAPVIRKLGVAKQSVDLNTSVFVQMVANEIGRSGFLDEHIEVIRACYKERRDMMLETMEEMFPSDAVWTRPEGGMFLWCRIREDLDAAEVFKTAIQQKVAFVPGEPFHPNGGGMNTMRLNFSYSDPETIREGITRLGRVLKQVALEKKP